MRALHAAVFVSVASHAALLWLIPAVHSDHDNERERERDAAQQPTASVEPPIEPATIEVVILDVPNPPPSLPNAISAISTRHAIASRSAERTASSEPRQPDPPNEPSQPGSQTQPNGTSNPSGTSLMTIRRPEKSALRGLSPKFLDDFLARSKPLAPIPDIPGARIDAEIADIQARMRNPNVTDRSGYLMQIAGLRAQRNALELKSGGGGRWKAEQDRFKVAVDPDGKVHVTDKPNVKVWITPLGIVGEFDATDAFMRGAGMDPYAREKLKLLDRTRDQREAIGRAHTSQQLAKSTQLVQRNLESLWTRVLDTPARKAALFELWDECVESGDDERVAAGVAARKLVIGFIRARLTGANAYTADELARLNRGRQSKAVFAPYDDGE